MRSHIQLFQHRNKKCKCYMNLSCEIRLNENGYFTFYGEHKDEIAKRYLEIRHDERKIGERAAIDSIIMGIEKLADPHFSL